MAELFLVAFDERFDLGQFGHRAPLGAGGPDSARDRNDQRGRMAITAMTTRSSMR